MKNKPSPRLTVLLLLAAMTFAAAAAGPEYTFTTYAGPPEAGPGAIDGPSGAGRFNNPKGLAVDPAGNLYVADTSNHTIRMVTPDGVVRTLAGFAGSPGSTDGAGAAARFNQPWGLTLDAAGNVYVADTGNHTLRRVTASGVVTTVAGTPGSAGSANGAGAAARFNCPDGVAVDSAGNLYVADSGNNAIRKVTRGGVVTTLASGFDRPNGVAADSAGNVYVADTSYSVIRKVTPGGVVTTLAGAVGSAGSADGTGSAARFEYPYGVAVDSAGNVYVTDAGDTLRKVTPGGVVTTLAGLGQRRGSAARFDYPCGVAVDSAGYLYVGDSGNNLVRKVTPGGMVTTLAGLAATLGAADGAGSVARFNAPMGVAVDGAHNLYVADMDNDTIRKVAPGGVVTTLAGLAGSFGTADGTGAAARFEGPAGVAVDSTGTVYVSDDLTTIRTVTPDGTVTTVAGYAGFHGAADGTGSAARFWNPCGLAVDSARNVYVADQWNDEIRKMSLDWVVTTLAGSLGIMDGADGTGSAAHFYNPAGVAVDAAGNLYVADMENSTIRKITPDATVTTLAGLAGNGGSADGTGSAARFDWPLGVAADSAGNVYVADSGNCTVRQVTPDGVVTTLAGLAGLAGSADGTGSAARFNTLSSVAVDSAGHLFVADSANYTIRVGLPACPDAPTIDSLTGPTGQSRQLDTSPRTAVAWSWSLIRVPAASSASSWSATVRNPTFTPDVADVYVFRLATTNAAGAISIRTVSLTAVAPPTPSITTPPQSQTAELGATVCFYVEVANAASGVACQWYLNGSTALAGANALSLSLTNVQYAQAGAYTVVVSNACGAATSAPAALAVIPAVPTRTVPALSLTGPAGSFEHVDYRDALTPDAPWQPLASFALTNPPQFCLDLSDPLPPARFYRAWQTNPPGTPPVLDPRLATEIPLTGPVGTSIRIDYINQFGPTDAWVTLDTVRLTTSSQLYFDLAMFRQPARLYRLVPGP